MTMTLLLRRACRLAWLIASVGMIALLLPTSLPAAAQESGYGAAMKAGRAAYKADDWAAAEKHFDAAAKAAENDRQKSSAIYAQGVVAQKQNKLPDAKKYAEQALVLNPGDKLAKGLLDEVNAPPPPPVKGKGKAAPKGLAKTPLAPGKKKETASAIDGAKAASAPDGAKVAPSAPASGAAAKPAKAAPKPPAAQPAAKTLTPADTAPPSPMPTPPAPPADKSGALQPTTTPGGGEKLATAGGPTAGGPAEPPTATASVVAAVLPLPVATPDAGGEKAQEPAKPMPAARPKEKAAGLPARARFVERTCGPDYRADDKFFARAIEISSGGAGTDEGEILMFDIACGRRARADRTTELVPASVIAQERGGEIAYATLRRVPDETSDAAGETDTAGVWSYQPGPDQRPVRIRIERDALSIVPTAGQVTILRRKLAENPSALDGIDPQVRSQIELAVSGKGYAEFRALRSADGLDPAFEKARKIARRHVVQSLGATAAAPTN